MSDKKERRAAKGVPINYHNGKIYKIVNDVNNMTFIGSTTTTLSRRFSQHKGSSQKTRINVAMKDIGAQHFNIILIENFASPRKDSLTAREYAIAETLPKDTLYNTKIYEQVQKENII